MSATTIARDVVVRLLSMGVTDVVVAPGSRSGPLARALVAADGQQLIRLHVRVDEREAAFLALGMAKVSRRATPVVTTSGTAAANLHPAMLEALHAHVPLVAITADRPGRLRGTGANQTTIQPGIFPGIGTVADIDDIDVAVSTPQHLNLELDEPLTEPVAWDFPTDAVLEPSDADPPPATRLEPGPRTVVVAGDAQSRWSGPQARLLAAEADWPLFAEPSSGARTGSALTSYRLLLSHRALADRIERVVSFGHPTLSRAVTSLLSRDVEIVHVGDQRSFPVPVGANVTFVEAVEYAGGTRETDDAGWLADWQKADAAVTGAVAALADAWPAAEPLRVARDVWEAVTPNGLLVVGSSNPIRDLDLIGRPFAPGQKRKVIANRGLAGIDGVVSTAVGAALARPSSRALAFMGDLTFLHGSNGLMMGATEPRPDLTIVIANDDGGGIFSVLEQGAPEFADSFERVFGTPVGANLAQLSASFGVSHERVSPGNVAEALATPRSGVHVLEVPIPRDSRRELSDRLTAIAAEVLSDLGMTG